MQFRKIGAVVALTAAILIPTSPAQADLVGSVALFGYYMPTDIYIQTGIHYEAGGVVQTAPDTYGESPSLDYKESYDVQLTAFVEIINQRTTVIDLEDTVMFPNRPSVGLEAVADASGTVNGSAHAQIRLTNYGAAGADSYGSNGLPNRGQTIRTTAAITEGIIASGASRIYPGGWRLWFYGGDPPY